MKLFSFWRSLATYRVRIALNLKGLVPMRCRGQLALQGPAARGGYRAVNPQMLLFPALSTVTARTCSSSLAILEYLDETHPQPPLCRRSRVHVHGCARSRRSSPAIASAVVRGYANISSMSLGSTSRRAQWIHNWIGAALKRWRQSRGQQGDGRYCEGDAITIADIWPGQPACGRQLLKYDTARFPTVRRSSILMQNDASPRASAAATRRAAMV